MREARLALVLLLLAAIPASAQEASRDRDGGVTITPYTAPLIGEVYEPPSGDDALSPEDEIAFARGLSLIRTGRVEEGLSQLFRLLDEYPTSPRLLSSAASTMIRTGRAREALELLERGDRERERRRERRAPEAAAEPRFARERADAWLSLGEPEKAIPWMAEAVDVAPQESSHLRSRLLEWAADPDLGPRVARALGERSDAAPERLELAMLAAEIEVGAGSWGSIWPRLRRAEEAVGRVRRGELVRALAQRLSARPGGRPEHAARVWLHLASGPHDEELRVAGLRRLLERPLERSLTEGAPPAELLSAEDLVEAWQGLTESPERVDLGLALSAHLRERGHWTRARAIGDALAAEPLEGDFAARAELERGLAALHAGSLDDSERSLLEARNRAADPEVRSRAVYALSEARFFAGDFDSARAGFDAFAREYPGSPLANDALERVLLLESGTPLGGGVRRTPALESLARGYFAEAREDWSGAAGHAREAERLAEPAVEGREPVRAAALLLLARAEEALGNPRAALAAALWVADSLAADRAAPVARRRAGDLLRAQGRPEEALRQYEELLARHPGSWLAPEVRRLVTELRAQRNP